MRKSPLYVLLFLLFAATACESNQTNEAALGTPAGATTFNPDMLFDMSQFVLPIDSSQAYLRSFMENYRYKNMGDSSFDSTVLVQEIPVSIIENLRSKISLNDSESAGIWIQYALTTSFRPDFLFGPMAMKLSNYTPGGNIQFKIGTPPKMYRCVDTNLVEVGDIRIPADLYKTHMLKKNAEGIFVPIIIDSNNAMSDPGAVYFPLVELDSLIADTRNGIAGSPWLPEGCKPTVSKLLFYWCAEKTEGKDMLIHNIVIVPKLEGSCIPAPGSTFVPRAANFNTPCPPHCAEASYRSIGH